VGASTPSAQVYYILPSYDSSIPNKLEGKVSTSNNFLESFLELMKDEYALNNLHSIVDQGALEVPITQKALNEL
jgi:hypothetical protein